MSDPYKSIAMILAAFCCRIHGREEDVAEDVREEAIKLAHEFKEVDNARKLKRFSDNRMALGKGDA